MGVCNQIRPQDALVGGAGFILPGQLTGFAYSPGQARRARPHAGQLQTGSGEGLPVPVHSPHQVKNSHEPERRGYGRSAALGSSAQAPGSGCAHRPQPGQHSLHLHQDPTWSRRDSRWRLDQVPAPPPAIHEGLEWPQSSGEDSAHPGGTEAATQGPLPDTVDRPPTAVERHAEPSLSVLQGHSKRKAGVAWNPARWRSSQPAQNILWRFSCWALGPASLPRQWEGCWPHRGGKSWASRHCYL